MSEGAVPGGAVAAAQESAGAEAGGAISSLGTGTGATAEAGSVEHAAFDMPEWAQGFDADQQKVVSQQKWQSPVDAVTSYAALRALSDDGARIRLPSDADDTEGWDKIHTKLGWPDSPEGYELPELEPQEGKIDLTPKIREWAHNRRMTQAQTAGITEDFLDHMAELQEQSATALQARVVEEHNEMRSLWGEKYEANAKAAANGANTLGLSSAAQAAIEREIGTKAYLDTFLRVSQSLGSHNNAGSQGGQGGGMGMSPEQARNKIAELHSNADWVKGLMAGEADKKNENDRLHQIGYSQEVIGTVNYTPD